MSADTMNPATAVTYGPFIQAAEAQYHSDPSQVSPAAITNMPARYTLVRTIQMTDSFGSAQSRVSTGTWRWAVIPPLRWSPCVARNRPWNGGMTFSGTCAVHADS